WGPRSLGAAWAGLVRPRSSLAVPAARRRALATGPSLRAFVSGVVAGALFLPAGLAALARGARVRGPTRELLAPALGLIVLGLGLRLPENNQSKFWNLLFLLLAPPAAIAWQSGLSRTRGALKGVLVAGLLVAAVPTVPARLG